MKTRNIIFLLVLSLFVGGDLWAIPAGFNIQGRLTDANGVNKDGTFQIKFSVFAVAEGGAAVWEKAMPTVMVKNGNFQIILQGEGDIGGQLEDAVKNLITAYVEIKVGTEPPLVPRQPLLRSPFGPPTVNLVGAVMFFAGAICPEGWRLANGDVLDNSEMYKPLSDYLGVTYGAAGKLPDMTDGSFVRSSGGDAAALGLKQADALKTHTHTTGLVYRNLSGNSGGTNFTIPSPAGNYSYYYPASGGPSTGDSTETRPRNYAMTPCIKY